MNKTKHRTLLQTSTYVYEKPSYL